MTKLFDRSKNKKGYTLVELSIVLALIAVVVSLVVTFLALMSNRVQQSNMRNDVLNDISYVEVGVKKWILHYDNTDYRFEIQDGTHGAKTVLCAMDTKGTDGTDDDTVAAKCYISDDGKKLVCEGTQTWDIKYIHKMAFGIETSQTSNSANAIISCDMQYVDPTADGGTEKYNATRLIFTTHAGAEIQR